jgi:hypothetical protein
MQVVVVGCRGLGAVQGAIAGFLGLGSVSQYLAHTVRAGWLWFALVPPVAQEQAVTGRGCMSLILSSDLASVYHALNCFLGLAASGSNVVLYSTNMAL